MPTTNEIVLRPRFKVFIEAPNDVILKKFETAKKTQSDFIVNRIDDHVFIKFPKQKQHFWSPQLHLEINAVNENRCVIHGLFGPNPTVWTFFMFIHFLVAGLFVAFGVWAYSNWSLKTSYSIQLSLMLFMVLIWIVLYLAGSIGKASSKEEMHDLKAFLDNVIS